MKHYSKRRIKKAIEVLNEENTTASKDFKQNPNKYSGQPKPPRFKKSPYDNLIYDYQAFQIDNHQIILEAKKDHP